MSYGVTEKCKKKKTLTLKINLSPAICNSKNEDTFFSHVICMLSFIFILDFCYVTPLDTVQFLFVNYPFIYIYIYIYIYTHIHTFTGHFIRYTCSIAW